MQPEGFQGARVSEVHCYPALPSVGHYSPFQEGKDETTRAGDEMVTSLGLQCQPVCRVLCMGSMTHQPWV